MPDRGVCRGTSTNQNTRSPRDDLNAAANLTNLLVRATASYTVDPGLINPRNLPRLSTS